MMSAPLARAASTNFFTFGTESAQRLRRSGVQVCTVKSITSSAVSFGTSVTGLSGGGAGSLAWYQSSMMVWARAGIVANTAAIIARAAIGISVRRMYSPRLLAFCLSAIFSENRYSPRIKSELTPDQVRGRLFRDHARAYRVAAVGATPRRGPASRARPAQR